MKVACLMLILFTAVTGLRSQGSILFDHYFIDRTMRIDYFQTGDADEVFFAIDQIYQQGIWAGNPKKLIDDFNSGMYYVRVYDLATNRLIYSRGFATLFGEYKTTDDAKHGIKKTYHQTMLVPHPKSKILLVVEGRDKHNILHPIFITKIDPGDVNIIRENPDENDDVLEIVKNGHPHDKVDLVFIAEGYAQNEKEKFKNDITRYTNVLFKAEPFKSNKSKFNVSGVFRPSAESGVDEPTKGIFRNTAVNGSYNALDTPRYLLVDDNKTMRDIAARVPYDAVIVITNTTRYGGGGIYNDYTIFTADDKWSENIFMHEFGHGFGNLADEYFGAPVAYNEFFPPGVEPHEPNITALLDPDNVKWKHLLSPGIEIPTPWGQDEMDSLRRERGEIAARLKKEISQLKKEGATQEKIQLLQTQLEETTQSIDEQIKQIRTKFQKQYKGKIGVFEGAGYSPRGLYRSEVHIGMFANGEYGKVSEEAILRIINHLSQ